MAEFRARAVVSEHDPIEVEVWDDYLTPVGNGQRPVREWVAEHLGNWSYSDWRDAFPELTEGVWEVVFEGDIQGSFHHYSGEWDEEIDPLAVVATQRLPDNWFGEELVL